MAAVAKSSDDRKHLYQVAKAARISSLRSRFAGKTMKDLSTTDREDLLETVAVLLGLLEG